MDISRNFILGDILRFLLGAMFIASAYLKGVNLDSFAETIHNFSGLIGIPAGHEKMLAMTTR